MWLNANDYLFISDNLNLNTFCVFHKLQNNFSNGGKIDYSYAILIISLLNKDSWNSKVIKTIASYLSANL